MTPVAWAECVAYLEAHCNYGRSTPYSATDLRYVLGLWTLAACAAANTILEIGIGPCSVSGVTFLHAMPPGSHLISVDIDPKLPQRPYLELAAEKQITWSVYHGDSISEAIHLDPWLQVDVLYVDGNHDAAHAIGDAVKFLPHLRAGGYLVIDDFSPQAGVGEGRKDLDELVPYFLHLAHEAPAGNGRLVWQRPV